MVTSSTDSARYGSRSSAADVHAHVPEQRPHTASANPPWIGPYGHPPTHRSGYHHHPPYGWAPHRRAHGRIETSQTPNRRPVAFHKISLAAMRPTPLTVGL